MTTAVHESGHALIGWHTPGTDPVDKLTIIPRGKAAGMTMFLPVEDRYSYSKEYINGQIRVLLGGRAAEYLILGADKVTTGASNDLDRVRDLVHRMVCDWGMSELGLLTFRGQEQTFLKGDGSSLDCSQDMSAKIDEQKRKIVDHHWHAALNMLKESEKELRALFKALFEKETLEAGDLPAILGPSAK
jgi:cell division protease FtsH